MEAGERVRLLEDRDGLRAGATGVVIGHYTNDGAVVVSFNGVSLRLPKVLLAVEEPSQTPDDAAGRDPRDR